MLQELLRTQGYINDILRPIVRPYAGAIGDDFILQDDNARPHCAHIVDVFIEDKGITSMEWPAKSSDLNPVEIHVGQLLNASQTGHLSDNSRLFFFRNGIKLISTRSQTHRKYATALQCMPPSQRLTHSLLKFDFVTFDHRPLECLRTDCSSTLE